MKKFLSKFKLKISKNHLRQVKNSLNDNFESIKYDAGNFKVKILNQIINQKKNKDIPILNEKEKNEIIQQIIDKNTTDMDLNSFGNNSPLVSIIIYNKTGLSGFKRLLNDFDNKLQYPSYEILVIDDGKNDTTIAFLEQLKDDYPIKIIGNSGNNDYSKTINTAANIAEGEYLLILNNTIVPTYGWLNQMMQSILKLEGLGAVGAKLIYYDCSDSPNNKNYSFKIKNTGIAFKNDPAGNIEPYNIDKGLNPLDSDSNSNKIRAAVSGDALLVEKIKYLEVEGLNVSYTAKYANIDLCLKLNKNGYKNIYCPKAVIFHYEYGDLKESKNKTINEEIKIKTLFIKNWNQYLCKHLLLDKLHNRKLFSPKPLKVAFAVTEYGDNVSVGDYFSALELGEGLKKLGWQISFLSKEGPGYWYEVNEDVDVVISMLDIFNPRRIRSFNGSIIKIAWPRNWFDRWVINPGFKEYDLVLAPSTTAIEYIKDNSAKKSFLFPIATNPTRFNSNIAQNNDYLCDYCFTGSYWNYPREIMDMLEPEELSYTFKLFGKNWDKIEKFKKYYKGFVNYSKLPEVYASTKIVIDDANTATKEYGAVNSRVFDALACGALIITNGEKGAKETFKDKLPVFKSKNELNKLIDYYLSNEDQRSAKIEELQRFVLENHTYYNRANTSERKVGRKDT